MNKIAIFLLSSFLPFIFPACFIDNNEGRFDLNYYQFTMQSDCNLFDEYFGIDNQGIKEITTQKDFDDFQNLFQSIFDNTEYGTSYGEMYNSTIDFSQEKLYVHAIYCYHESVDFTVTSLVTDESTIKLSLHYDINVPAIAPSYYSFIYITVDKNDDKAFESVVTSRANYNQNVCYKPIIYFYTEKDLELEVKYVNDYKLLTTYPKYNNGWDLLISKNGTVKEVGKDRSYYAIYFDEIATYYSDFSEGFYVTKDNAISFLEESLDALGFTEREANEFIMYWLPVLEQNEKSLVYFEQTAERNAECPLEFSTNPDTMLRVIIHIKKVDNEQEIKEQKLEKVIRQGFSVVEWGGMTY